VRKFSLVFSLIVVAGVSHADLRSDLKAYRQKLEKAVLAKDVKGAEKAMKESVTSDFKYKQGSETQDFKTFIGNFNASIVMAEKITSSSSRIVSLKETGDRATGQVEHKMKATMKMQDNKVHQTDWTGIFTEEYRKVGGKWKIATMTAGAQKFLVDGKPAKM